MNIRQLIENAETEAAKSIHQADGDYIGEDGLLYCGKCRTKKQGEYNFPWGVVRPNILCECEAAKHKAEQEANKSREFFEKAWSLPIARLHDKTIEAMSFEADDGRNPNLVFAEKYVARWEEMRKRNVSLCFSGGVGCGKSYAAACIVNALNRRKIPAMFLTTSAAIDKGLGLKAEFDFLKQMNAFDLIVFDDFGAERWTEYSVQKLFELVNARVQQNKPMIFTTNLTRAELANAKSIEEGRIYSRVTGACTLIEFKGGDLRQQNGATRDAELARLLFE